MHICVFMTNVWNFYPISLLQKKKYEYIHHLKVYTKLMPGKWSVSFLFISKSDLSMILSLHPWSFSNFINSFTMIPPHCATWSLCANRVQKEKKNMVFSKAITAYNFFYCTSQNISFSTRFVWGKIGSIASKDRNFRKIPSKDRC